MSGTATDVDAGDTLTYSMVSGPAWLAVDGNGALTGTPANSDVGLNSFTVKVTDAAGAFATATLNITVANTNDAPAFTSGTITGAGATEDAAYSGTLAGTATDVDAGDTLTYSKVSGPSWLAVAADGVLTGTPTNGDGGSNSFIVRVTDLAGSWAEATLQITVTVTDPDANDNGILDDWETTHFGNANPGSNPADGDADHDGLSNFLEYALATAPTAANPNPITSTAVEITGQRYFQMTVPKNPSATNVTYVVEATDDPSGPWSSFGLVVVTDDANQLVVRDSQPLAGAPRRFFRLRATAAP